MEEEEAEVVVDGEVDLVVQGINQTWDPRVEAAGDTLIFCTYQHVQHRHSHCCKGLPILHLDGHLWWYFYKSLIS